MKSKNMRKYEDIFDRNYRNNFPICKLTGILIFENCKSHIVLIMYDTNVRSFVEKTAILLIA